MQELLRQLEALLFAAARPIPVSELSEATKHPAEDVEAALELLQSELEGRGVQLVRSGHSAELVTAPDLAPIVEPFLQAETQTPLSKPALETLAIILHKQPVTKLAIEEVRGVASDQIIRNLLSRGLIEQSGRSSEPGKPPQYTVTTRLLSHLGASSPDDLKLIKDADAR